MIATTQLLAAIPDHLPAELIETLAENANVRIERIVSHGHASAPGFWYDQPRHEWVLVLKGTARLQFENDASLIELKPGCAVNIPAHTRHRVEWTAPNEPTIWLAVHFDGP